MRCSFKYCLYEHSDELIPEENSKRKYHAECKKDMAHLDKIGDLWIKYINDTESWAFMRRKMYEWYMIHSAEYMLFCLCKVIREKRPIKHFSGLYYCFNDLTYKKMYEAMKEPKEEHFIHDNVIMTMAEKAMLLKYMDGNEVRLNYYIDALNKYIKSTNKSYENHAKTITDWYDRDEAKKPVAQTNIVNKLGGRVND